MDADRRNRLLELFKSPRFNSDRAKLIKQSKLTKGRIAQFFDEDQAFGERAARSLALRLHLPADYFELPSGSAEFDEDTVAFAKTYQRMSEDERHKLRLLYQVARSGVHPDKIRSALTGEASATPVDVMLANDSGLGDLATPSNVVDIDLTVDTSGSNRNNGRMLGGRSKFGELEDLPHNKPKKGTGKL